ncbi:hypothetical protein JCM1841_002748 [Sporobolomyces salmonicolor]
MLHFAFSPAIIPLAASLFFSPVVVQAAPTSVSAAGLAIPLGQRKQGVPITKEDGTVNTDSLQRQLQFIKAKYQQSIAAYLQNTGETLGEILEQANDTASSSSQSAQSGQTAPQAVSGSQTRRRKRQSEQLYDYQNDLLWAGDVRLGTPPQDFTILFDTGSADLWVPSSDVQCTGCNGNKYDPSLSTTSQNKPGHFEIYYGDGSSTSGPIYTDVLQIGDFYDNNAYFSAVDQMSDSFASEPEDGIMGMAYASISDIQPRSQSQATSKPFGLRIAKTADGTSELFLGGPNPNMYSGRIEWHPVQKQAYYNITGQVYLGGNAVFNDPRSTIIDSGTTLIIAPPGDADAFWAQVPGATKWDQSDGYYIYPCAKTPQVSFNFDGGKKWTVRAVDMNLGKTSSHSQKCVGAIAGVDVGLGPSTWILGCSFLKNVYTVFDPADTNSVGFAVPA